MQIPGLCRYVYFFDTQRDRVAMIQPTNRLKQLPSPLPAKRRTRIGSPATAAALKESPKHRG